MPYRLSGFSGYSAGGVVCFILTSQGLPCRNVIRLADQPASQIEVFTGTLSSSNTVVQFDGTFMFGPTLLGGGATLSGGALIRATGTLLPCLDIQLDAARENYYVTWASAFHEFHLDRTESLSTPINWQRVNDSLVFTQGSSNVTRWLNEPGQAFYRLSNQ